MDHKRSIKKVCFIHIFSQILSHQSTSMSKSITTKLADWFHDIRPGFGRLVMIMKT